MISIDTNILFLAAVPESPFYTQAGAFLDGMAERTDVLLCEFVLVELYRLLRNPVVCKQPLSAAQAVNLIQHWREHPFWLVAGFPPDARQMHDEMWRTAARSGFAYRRIFDARLALSLRYLGVTEFATTNIRDFQDFGFARVWNPLAPRPPQPPVISSESV